MIIKLKPKIKQIQKKVLWKSKETSEPKYEYIYTRYCIDWYFDTKNNRIRLQSDHYRCFFYSGNENIFLNGKRASVKQSMLAKQLLMKYTNINENP